MKFATVILLLATVAIGALAQGDGGCASSGMQPYDYSQVLCMSFLFYEAQRSGPLPSDMRIGWRGDSALGDGQDNGIDLTGGYYDAGDFVKFGFPMAFSTTGLAWGLIAYPNGYAKSGQTAYAQSAIRWATDYFLKCHTAPHELWGQVGDGNVDHSYWGRPEEMTMQRPSWKIDEGCPGSELAGETSAALAAASIVFQTVDAAYSSRLLTAAMDLFTFADQFRGTYDACITNAGNFYHSYSGYGDELAWSALWLYKATGDNTYMDRAKALIDEFGLMFYADMFDWDSKTPGVYALMAELDGSATYTDNLNTYMNYLMTQKPYTPQGMLFMGEWGSLRESANVAFIGVRAASLGLNSATYNSWAQQQADYMLGSTGRSYVVGFGVNPPQSPHHRSSSCPDEPAVCDQSAFDNTGPNPQTLFGALVGGPDQNDQYVDSRQDYQHNEVADDYNGLFSGLMAAMAELH